MIEDDFFSNQKFFGGHKDADGPRPGAPFDARPGRRHAETEWDASPLVYEVDGVNYEFFTIGALAAAMGRSVVTIRAWEDWGALPSAVFRGPRTKKIAGKKVGVRLYTRRQIVGILKIAADEGVGQVKKLDNFSHTNFTQRVIDLFKATATLGPADEA